MDSVVLLDGGHRVHLAGIAPGEVEHCLDEAFQNDRSFIYLQPENYPDNGVVIQSASVVGVVARV
jgi:hypothetical protein